MESCEAVWLMYSSKLRGKMSLEVKPSGRAMELGARCVMRRIFWILGKVKRGW